MTTCAFPFKFSDPGVDPERFQALASRLLHKEGKEPESCRTAISRCYYATFHVAKGVLEPHFTLPPDATAHKLVRRLLSYADDIEVRKVSQELDGLRDRRNDADYRLSLNDVEQRQTAQHQVNVAAEQIRTLRAIAAGPQWSTILDQIRRKASLVSPPGSGSP